MLFIALAALAVGATPAPNVAPAGPAAATAAVSAPPSAADKATKAANQAAQMSMFADMAVKAMNRILPPQPDPDPARLALARITMDGFMPAGSYGRMANMVANNLMTGVYDRLMGMTGAELSNVIGLPVASGADASMTLRQQASKGDPLFDVRMKAYVSAFNEELKTTMGIVEPKMREGMARAMARRFDAGQLADLNRFFATGTGRAFGQDMMLLWVDGDVFRGMFAAMPDLMRAMPHSAERFAAIERQYPWPKKVETKKAAPVRKRK